MKNLIFLTFIFLPLCANLNNENPFQPFKLPESNQEDILKARKGQNFSKKFRDLVLEVANEDVRSYLALAKQHFECLKDPACKSDFNENRKVVVGSTGVGKTTLAQVIAEELGIECIVVDAALLANEYANSAVNNFARAIASYIDKPCVIVLDEFDAILKALGANNSEQKVPQQVWQILDRLEKMPHILVIGTTNSLEEIPVQLRSRFKDNLIESPKEIPKQLKKKIIIHYLDDRAHNCSDIELDQIISSIPSYFCRDIEKLVKGAISNSKKRNTAPFLITKSDFDESFKRMKAGEKLFEKEKEGWGGWTMRKTQEYGDVATKSSVFTGAAALTCYFLKEKYGIECFKK